MKKSGVFLNVIRWVAAVIMWFMALGTLSFGGVGILGAILFALFGFIVSPLSSKYLFPKLPNLKKSHKILGAVGIWLAANIFMGIAVPSTSTTDTDITPDVSAVAESTTEAVERAMPSTTNEESEDIASTASEKEAIAQKAAEEEAAKKAAEEEAAAQKAAEEEAAKKAAEEEAAAQKAAEEEAAAQKAAEEEAAKKAAEEEAAAQKAAEEAAQQAPQQVDSSTVANGTESASALAVLQMGPTTGSPCWVPRNGGTKYHTTSSCSGMDDPIYTTVDTATACGFDACKRCH